MNAARPKTLSDPDAEPETDGRNVDSGRRDQLRILIADALSPHGKAALDAIDGIETTVQTGLAGADLAAAISAADGVVVRSAVQITSEVLEQAAGQPSCRLRGIARAGVGVDNIDVEAATHLGVAVLNSASASTITTAEHAFALMIALARNIAPAAAAISAGRWDRSKFVGRQLHGRTLGVIGLGRIGRTLAQRALAFGMTVRGYDPFINAEAILEGQVPLAGSLGELMAECDIVSLHIPKTESSAGLIDRQAIAAAKPGFLLINAARGGLIDEAALLEAIDSGQCGGAAIDVFEIEPPPIDSPLRAHPKILATPHLGASTVEAQEAVAVSACQALVEYLLGRDMGGVINAGGLTFNLTDRQRSFIDLAQRMIALLHAVNHAGSINTFQCTVRGETLSASADTVARYALAEFMGRHLDQPINLINAAVVAEQRHIEARTIIASDIGEDRLSIEIISDNGVRRVDGAIYEDGLPRITLLDGYAMDMAPAGHMIVLTNADEPGRIGLVGRIFGDAGVNIAEMVIGRKHQDAGDGMIAMMILKLDAAPTEALLEALRSADGIVDVAAVELAGVADNLE